MAYGGWRSMLHRTLLRLARIAYGDSSKCFNNDGTPIPIRELHPDERAMIASVDLDDGGKPTRIKFWNKNEALTELMKPLGLYERNNVQRSENLALQ